MLQITNEIIRSWNPCYDPIKYLKDTWKGTILDLLQNRDIPAGDKVWLATQKDVLSTKTLRLFAAHCARQVTPIKNLSAIEACERYAMGQYSLIELRYEWRKARSLGDLPSYHCANPCCRLAARFSYRSLVQILSHQEHDENGGSLYKTSMAKHGIEKELIKTLIKLIQQYEV